MNGKVIFVSHEWLGWTHADPNGEQFYTLRRILQRLMQGKVSKVESHYLQQLVFKQNTVVDAGQWKAALPSMFVWFDFMSIPQLGARGTETDNADTLGRSICLSSAATERRAAEDLNMPGV